MIVVDVNLLLYAVDEGSPFHADSKAWLARQAAAGEILALPWTVILAFLRLSTSRHVFARPLPLPEAAAIVDAWLAHPGVRALDALPEQWAVLRALLHDHATRPDLVMDAHLAALTMAHGATLCTADRDFRRFDGLRLWNPLETDAPRRPGRPT